MEVCLGAGTQTGKGISHQNCPVCRRVFLTAESGRIPRHKPSRPKCRDDVWSRGSVSRCSRNAVDGGRYCKQHGKLHHEPAKTVTKLDV